MSGPSSPTLYDLLQVRSDATTQEVRGAWRKLAQEHHPDRGGPGDPDTMTRINQAYEVLSDPDRRARYDQQLLAVRKPRRYGLAAVLQRRAGLLTAVAVSATAVLAAGAWTMLRPGTPKPMLKPIAASNGQPATADAPLSLIPSRSIRNWTPAHQADASPGGKPRGGDSR